MTPFPELVLGRVENQQLPGMTIWRRMRLLTSLRLWGSAPLSHPIFPFFCTLAQLLFLFLWLFETITCVTLSPSRVVFLFLAETMPSLHVFLYIYSLWLGYSLISKILKGLTPGPVCMLTTGHHA